MKKGHMESYPIDDIDIAIMEGRLRDLNDLPIGADPAVFQPEEIPARSVGGTMDSKTMNARVYSLSDVSMFLGWVCVEIPELHSLECPKLLEAWYKYCAQMGIPSADSGDCDAKR